MTVISGFEKPLAFASSASTDGEGRYRLEGVALGPLKVQVNHQAFTEAVKSLEVREGENRLDFTLSRGQTVAGRVVDAQGDLWALDAPRPSS